MYWPIGIPQYHTAWKGDIPDRTAVRSDDKTGIRDENEVEQANTRPNGQQSRESSSTGTILEDDNALVQNDNNNKSRQIVDIATCRNAHIFATITPTSLSIWQTKPTVLLATAVRSAQSIESYGRNVGVLMRADSFIIVVQSENGFLITYSLASDADSRVYKTQVLNAGGGHVRKQSTDDYRRPNPIPPYGPCEGGGIRDVNIQFRMVIRIDAGISKVLALEHELLVATSKPSAIQCIRWSPDGSGSSHSTELLKRMPWIAEQTIIKEMVYDRPMSLHVWIGGDGKAYAAQRQSRRGNADSNSTALFQGHCFHTPQDETSKGVKAAVNARFSLVAVGCADAAILVFTAKDYLGNVPLSNTLRLPVSLASSGSLTFLSYSPDGYVLFAGFERGWAIWSVYGKLGANSFSADQTLAEANCIRWLGGVKNGFWAGGGSEMILLGMNSHQICTIEMARSSVTSCFAMPNIFRSFLQTSTSIMLYRGINVDDVTTIAPDTPLWQTVQLPASYLATQWPIKCSVVSPDGKYVAAAGRRGLVHHSLTSGRWRTFEDPAAENEFTVRGGMCWYQHILLAAVEANGLYQVRLFSREKSLDSSSMLHVEAFDYPIIHMALSGADSLLVYTHENILFHYLFVAERSAIKLAQVGQIAFHGIIRAPARVRSISWLLPDEQREHGEPSQDVATATVLFLVDGKLVLLQPSTGESGELKYDMRVIAQDVEHYVLTREQDALTRLSDAESLPSNASAPATGDHLGHSLRDSLWFFDGKSMRVWTDIQDVLAYAPADLGRDLPPTVSIYTDFYPLSAMIVKGVLTGLEPEIVQRRDVDFAYSRFQSRTHLFIPPLLRHHLAQYDSPAALHLSDSYQKLPYFAHALEILLHDVLDDEVDASPNPGDTSLLASVLSFLSSFPAYLDIVVGCTRKTELRSWHTLFQHMPPVQELFEESLQRGLLKTAGGFLLVLHTFDEESFNTQQIARLLRSAREAGEYDLCKELARFLVGIDDSGAMLRSALSNAGMKPQYNGTEVRAVSDGGPETMMRNARGERAIGHRAATTPSAQGTQGRSQTNGSRTDDDYFTYR